MLISRILRNVLLFAGCLAAQQVPFVRITGENAPSGGGSLLLDKQGGLWIAANEGGRPALSYFDGSRFFPVFEDSSTLGRVIGIAQDEDGGLWLSSEKGLFRLSGGEVQKKVDGYVPNALAEVAPNTLLANVRNSGDGRLDLIRVSKAGDAWKVEVITHLADPIQFRSQPNGEVIWIQRDGFGVFPGRNAAGWPQGRMPAIAIHPFPSPPGMLPPANMLRDRFGCLWMRNRQSAWYQCPAQPQPLLVPSEIVGRGADSLLELPDGSIAIPSFARLAVGRPGAFHVVTAVNGYPSIGGFIAGRDNTLWFASANGLFAYLPKLNMEFWTERDGLGGNTWSILPQGRKVFAIAGEEVRVLDDDRMHWRLLRPFPFATHIAAGPENTILATSETQGVAQIAPDGQILRRSAPGNESMLARAPDGRIWSLGAHQITGVSVKGARIELTPIRSDARLGGGRDMHIDPTGDLWACTNAGVVHKEGENWRVISVKEAGIADSCMAFAVDGQRDLWYADPSPGLYLLEHPARGPAFRRFAAAADLGSGITHFLGTDRRGWLWRGSSDGVYIADAEQARQGQWLWLNRTDGLPAVDTNQRSFAEASDGSVWFGMDNAVVHMSPPGDLVRPAYAPDIFISSLSWNGGAPHLARLVDRVESSAFITTHIGSLQFDRRNALRLRYRLLPDQPDWRMGKALDITLGRLHWGEHRLQVQARLGSGPWSPIQEKSFAVLKPIWLSWPALCGFILAGGAAGAGSYRRRRRRLAREKDALPGLTQLRGAMLSPQLESLNGMVLGGRFEIGAELERGGFATVFTGRDRRQGNALCAIKIFRRDMLESGAAEESFRKEAEVLRRIEHPNIVRVYADGATPGGSPYLAMEFIHGATLRKRLGESRLSRREIASYLRQMGDALAALHASRIWHRDIKPENLMIRDKADAGRELVLIDFSIALVKDPDKSMQGLTRMAGTLHYMAPEQSLGYADASSDIYSLAKVVVEMLLGERVAILLPHSLIDLPLHVRELLSARGLMLRPGTVDLLASALEFHPNQRPGDVQKFAEEICRDLES